MLSPCVHLVSEPVADLHTPQVKSVELREVLLVSWNVPVPLYTLHDSHQGNELKNQRKSFQNYSLVSTEGMDVQT